MFDSLQLESMIELCDVNDLEVGEMRGFVLPNYPPIALYNVEGEFYCTDDTCTHGAALLTDGELDGQDVICPFHDGSFNVCSGKASSSPCIIPLKTHRIEVVGGKVMVELK